MERLVFMSETKYEVILKLSKTDLRHLQWGLLSRIENMVKDDDGIASEDLALHGLLEPHIERIEMLEEQQELDKKIKDLEKRRNELRG